MTKSCDLLVLGAGPGGYVAAIRAAQLGLSTVCVEKEELGGVCLNWGCIPSKALLHAAAGFRQIAELADYGITADNPKFDTSTLRMRKNHVVRQLVQGVETLLKRNNVEVLNGRGEFTSRTNLTVKLNDGGTVSVNFKKAIIATGSKPAELPHLKIDGKNVWGAKAALEFDPWPKKLLVIGGGAIGVEFANFYAGFGTEVTVVELLPHLLPTLDKELGMTLGRAFKKRKIGVRTAAKVASLEVKGDHDLAARIEPENGDPLTLECDQVLLAIGQKPYLEGIAADKLGLKLTAQGFIEVNEHLETSIPGIYAIGDVTGHQLLAHKASHEGVIAAEAAAGKTSRMNWNTVPGGVFTEPEVASVGMTEAEATEAGHKVKSGKFPLAANGKSIATRHTDGFVKIIADADDDTVLGAHIIGQNAADLVGTIAFAMEMQATTEDLAQTIFVHPTVSEAIAEAALDSDREAIHIYNPKR